VPFAVRSPELPRRRRAAKNPALSVVVLGVKLLPAVLPAYVISLRSGLGLGLGLGWMFVAAAELLGASQGLGYLLLDGEQLGKPAEIVAAIVAFAIVGKATDWLIVLIAAPFLRWEDVARRD